MSTTAEVLMTILGVLIDYNTPKATPKQMAPPAIERPAPKIKRCKWPCERSA